MGRGQVVRHRFLVSCIVGSNPTAPAIRFLNTPNFDKISAETGSPILATLTQGPLKSLTYRRFIE